MSSELALPERKPRHPVGDITWFLCCSVVVPGAERNLTYHLHFLTLPRKFRDARRFTCTERDEKQCSMLTKPVSESRSGHRSAQHTNNAYFNLTGRKQVSVPKLRMEQSLGCFKSSSCHEWFAACTRTKGDFLYLTLTTRRNSHTAE